MFHGFTFRAVSTYYGCWLVELFLLSYSFCLGVVHMRREGLGGAGLRTFADLSKGALSVNTLGS